MRVRSIWRLGVLAAAVIATAALAAPAFGGAVISNGVVALGVNDHGQLNFSDGTRFVGVTYEPTGNDGTRAGCECEGWGAGAGGPTLFQGRANDALGGPSNLALVSFTSTATTATSIADVLLSGSPALRVTHAFVPSPVTPNLYEITITLENLTSDTLTNVRYERLMDWDVEPTAFSEFVTINRGSTPPSDLIYSDDNGFGDNFPFPTPKSDPLDPATVNTNYTDKGPADHGARFTFDFGSLAPGGTKTFVLFYGAAGTEVDANAAVSAAGLEMFSYGQPNTVGGPDLGTPNTFIWGFAAVGGVPVIPPTLTLTPETATNPVGDSHTVTAELKDSSGNPVPGATIVFEVSGANPQPAATRTTGADGKATFTYTGANPGVDAIKACLDGNSSGTCDVGEVTDTAEKTWTPVDGAACWDIVDVSGSYVGDRVRVMVTYAAPTCTDVVYDVFVYNEAGDTAPIAGQGRFGNGMPTLLFGGSRGLLVGDRDPDGDVYVCAVTWNGTARTGENVLDHHGYPNAPGSWECHGLRLDRTPPSTSSTTTLKTFGVTSEGRLIRERYRTVTIIVKNAANGAAVDRASVRVSGVGLTAKTKSTNGSGVVKFYLRPTKLGRATFRVTKTGLAAKNHFKKVWAVAAS